MDRWMQIVYPERYLAYQEAVRQCICLEESLADQINKILHIIDSNFQNHAEALNMQAYSTGIELVKE